MENILIIGGGTAGFMTAAALVKAFPNKKISLIESKTIPTVGVGESTIVPFRKFLKFLEIKDEDFLKECDGSYKLSIRFQDFYKKGSYFHYPFGRPFLENTKAGFNDWWFKKTVNPDLPFSDYADSFFPMMALVNQNKILKKSRGLDFEINRDSAFHIDATKFGNWLKEKYCKPKGLNHIVDDIVSVQQDENGIVSLNNKYKADLYIDCTGFKSLLLGQTLKEEFISFEHLLPNNSAWATHIPYQNKEKELKCYTNCTAYNNGWIWDIPLWSRRGTGYVYSDKFISDDDALTEFKQYLKIDNLEFKKIKMKVGIHKRVWVKNVVAIGLAAGFIEPLESNGLYTVHEFLLSLLRNLRGDTVSQLDRDTFNFHTRQLFQNFAEFVALHYALSHREDTPYWKANKNKEWGTELLNRISPLTEGISTAIIQKSFVFHFPSELGFHCIAAGMNWASTDIYNLIYVGNFTHNQVMAAGATSTALLNKKIQQWKELPYSHPTLYQYLNEEIYHEA